MKWQLLSTISAPMPFQMALDQLLFEKQKNENQKPLLRFYYSSEPWISVGYSFRDASSFSRSELVRTHPSIPVCRRLTGGGCVFHGRDLIFSFIVRTDVDPEKLGSVRTSYSKIHESVKMGFEALGLNLKFYRLAEELPKGNDCFRFPVVSDLAWKGQKIAGGAQKRSQGVLLHQESIQVPDGMESKKLIAGIIKGFEAVFNVTVTEETWDPGLFFEAEKGKGLTESH